MTDIVDIGLAVDSSDVKRGRSELSKLGDQSTKTKRATDSLIDSFKGYATLAAVGAVMTEVINQHRTFQKSISELSSITGAAGKDLEFYKQQALDMGASTTFAADQVATAFKLVASAKPDLLESKEALAVVTREVLTLAEASGMELPAAADALGGALNQYQAGADQASRFINVLAAGSKFGASAINDTSVALKNVGAVANSLDISFETTNAAIQSLAAVSIKGGEAGTGLRNVLLKLSTQANDKINPEIVGLSQALKNLGAENLSTAEKTKLFGLENITAATALIEQADSLEELEKKLTSTSVAYEQASINTDNLDGDIKNLSSSWSNAALLLGDALNPALRFATQLLAKLGKIASSIVIAFEDMGDALGAVAAQAAAALSADFDMVSEIGNIRSETRKMNDERIKNIWAEKEATDKLVESRDALKATETVKKVEAKKVVEATETKTVAEITGDDFDAHIEAHQKFMAEKKRAREQEILDNEMALQSYKENLWTEEESLAASYQRKAEMLATAKENELITEQEHKALMLYEEGEYLNELARMRQNSEEQEKLSWAARFSMTMGVMGKLTAGVASQSKKMFAINKAAAIGTAIMNTYESATASFKALAGIPIIGPALGAAAAAVAIAAGLKNVSAIKSSKFGGGSASAGSVPTSIGVPGTGTPPAVPPVQTVQEAPQQEEKQQRDRKITLNFGDVRTPVLQTWLRDEFAPVFKAAVGDDVDFGVEVKV